MRTGEVVAHALGYEIRQDSNDPGIVTVWGPSDSRSPSYTTDPKHTRGALTMAQKWVTRAINSPGPKLRVLHVTRALLADPVGDPDENAVYDWQPCTDPMVGFDVWCARLRRITMTSVQVLSMVPSRTELAAREAADRGNELLAEAGVLARGEA